MNYKDLIQQHSHCIALLNLMERQPGKPVVKEFASHYIRHVDHIQRATCEQSFIEIFTEKNPAPCISS